MILIDTSAWIEYLRNTGSPTCDLVGELLSQDIAICGPVSMEVMAGALSESHLRSLRELTARADTLMVHQSDYEDAAALYRLCRQQGRTVRSQIDCLIAAVAIRNDVPVLHADADFDVMARYTALRIYSATNGR